MATNRLSLWLAYRVAWRVIRNLENSTDPMKNDHWIDLLSRLDDRAVESARYSHESRGITDPLIVRNAMMKAFNR